MQATLRIDDRLYREAKAEAAREGVSLTRFLEEGLRLRLEKKSVTPAAPHSFRVFEATTPASADWDAIRRLADEDQEAHDLAKLGLAARPS
jgi:hypothetical protein